MNKQTIEKNKYNFFTFEALWDFYEDASSYRSERTYIRDNLLRMPESIPEEAAKAGLSAIYYLAKRDEKRMGDLTDLWVTSGKTKKSLAFYFHIPLRTVEDWSMKKPWEDKPTPQYYIYAYAEVIELMKEKLPAAEEKPTSGDTDGLIEEVIDEDTGFTVREHSEM